MEHRNSFEDGAGSDLEGSYNSADDSSIDNSSQYTDSEERSNLSNGDIDNL